MASICLLLVLACSSAIVIARDQVDVASLPVEVRTESAGNLHCFDLTAGVEQ